MSVVVRSWQPMIKALSKRLCIMTRDMTYLQHFLTGSKCPENNRHSARCEDFERERSKCHTFPCNQGAP